MKLRPHGLTAELLTFRIRSLVRHRHLRTGSRFSALPLKGTLDASPKAISGRTSYHPVRLEFLLYPQLIPEFCNIRGFGPPFAFTQSSAWPWVAHWVSGLAHATFKKMNASGKPETFIILIRTINPRFHYNFAFVNT